MLISLNGNLIPLEEAKISVTDYGFLFGYAIFETMHAYDGTVFRLQSHLDRMSRSLSVLEIPFDKPQITKAIRKTISENKLRDARVRLTVSAGPGNPVTDLSSCKQPTILVIALPHAPMTRETYEKGFALSIARIRRNSQSLVQNIKKTDYMESILARREARRNGADDALFLNDRGFVAEGSTNNVFIVNGGVLKTPSLENGILPGITRDAVLDAARRACVAAQETDILPAELLSADEVFITSTMMEIMPVTRIDANTIGNGKLGPVTAKLSTAFKDLVREEIGRD